MAANATTAAAATTRTLVGEDVLKIKRTNLVRSYQSESEGFKGKSYRIYAFGDKAFAVHEDDDFHEDYKNGDVKSIDLTVSDEGWSLSSYITWKRANAMKLNQAKHDSITPEMFKLSGVSKYEELV